MPLPTDIVEAELATRRQASDAVAMKMPLVHVESNVCDLVMNPPHEIPTSATDGKSNTKRTEELLGLPPSAYFYAGRACPDFGNRAFAFAAECEAGHTGAASPFDTGGLMSQRSHLKLRLNPNDGEAERVTFGKASTIRWIVGVRRLGHFSRHISTRTAAIGIGTKHRTDTTPSVGLN